MTAAVGVTGSSGFLGWHLRCHLAALHPSVEVIPISRETFGDDASLQAALERCDAVVHLAAVNSHDRAEAAENVDLADRLVAALEKTAAAPTLVYANSAHIDSSGSAYGRAKGDAASILGRWAGASSAAFTDLVLPNLFGEAGRPRYNSAVATFCEAVAEGTEATVKAGATTRLLHAQDACESLVSAALGRSGGRTRLEGREIGIPELYDTLARYAEEYVGTHSVPNLVDRFHLRLFNQLRFTHFPAGSPVTLVRRADDRGAFVESARGHGQTQTSFSTTRPGKTRGEHWHLDKIERFLVIRGEGTIEIRTMFDDEVHTFVLNGDEPAFVDMPTLQAHNITNTGDDELVTMFWANDHFDPRAPDTFPEPVRRQVPAP
jgi:UDP-2-acetamido-2,6-beta-L-arabino-hexul-4-ose reductase